MEITLLEPTTSARIVEQLAFVETSIAVVRTLLPEPAITIGLRYRGASAVGHHGEDPVPVAVVSGFRVTTRRMHTAAESGIVLARLRPGASRAVLGRALEPLFGATAPLAAWLGEARVAEAREAVCRAACHEERAAIVEQLLVTSANVSAVDALVDRAVAAIVADGGTTRVGELADRLGVSVDTLEKRFRHATGATPKACARIVRVRRALLAAKDEPTLARAAAAAGYFDESHFVRDVKAVTGTTPARFVAHADEAC